ncbi:hypothetical protein ACLOJK_014858 [Asimina triloba]
MEPFAQGMYVLSNVATGNEFHKEGVMHHLLPPEASGFTPSAIIRFLQDNNSCLRTAAMWCIINLTYPDSPGAMDRVTRLRSAGIISQIKHMVNDPCLEVKVKGRFTMFQYHIEMLSVSTF